MITYLWAFTMYLGLFVGVHHVSELICGRSPCIWVHLWSFTMYLGLFVVVHHVSGFICERSPCIWVNLWSFTIYLGYFHDSPILYQKELTLSRFFFLKTVIHLFLRYSRTVTSTKETFRHDFVVIQKRALQNYQKIVKKCYYMHYEVFSRFISPTT